jgi:spectinomycin phosphotransferase
MLEKPNIPDGQIIINLREEYRLHVAELSFLPLGADQGTAVYRVVAQDGRVYFLKLRRGFEEITVTVPLFLRSQGIQEIIAPIETISKGYWADFGEYKLVLYPFVQGNDGFERELTDSHRKIIGTALKRIHSAEIPPELTRRIPRETFDSRWRNSLRRSQKHAESGRSDDPVAVKLAAFMDSRRAEIDHLMKRAKQLASALQSNPLEMVLCHTDIHGGNILLSNENKLYIVDWDNPLLAPKERDLMFIGGGIDAIWKSEAEEAVFYEGYGETKIDFRALTYYRYQRVIEDLAVISEQLFLSNEGGADRERAYGWFTSNFEPGGTIEIAQKTDGLLSA